MLLALNSITNIYSYYFKKYSVNQFTTENFDNIIFLPLFTVLHKDYN